jgi:acetyl esterase/lipase
MQYEIWTGPMPLECATWGQVPKLEPFLADTGKTTGAVIVLPGGGYEDLMEHEGPPIAKWLQSCGISAFVLSYRVKPYRHPASLEDTKQAIRFLRANCEQFNICPSSIAVMGFSSGGHLAATVGTLYDLGNSDAMDPIQRLSCRPDAMVVAYGPISVVGLNLQMINLLGPRGEQSDEDRLLLSVERNVTSQTPPAFLWHTGEDEFVDPQNPLLFAMAMAKHRLNCELHLYAKGSHGLELAKNAKSVSTWTTLCENWLTDLGFKGN